MKEAIDKAVSTRDLDLVVNMAWPFIYPSLQRYYARRGVPQPMTHDMIQNVFALVASRWDRFDGRNFLGWIWSLAHYELRRWCTEASREVTRQDPLGDEFPSATGWGSAEAMRADAETQRVLLFLQERDPVDAEIFRARYLLGANDIETASILYATFEAIFSPEAVRARLYRLRLALADRFSRDSWGCT